MLNKRARVYIRIYIAFNYDTTIRNVFINKEEKTKT